METGEREKRGKKKLLGNCGINHGGAVLATELRVLFVCFLLLVFVGFFWGERWVSWGRLT